MTRSGMMSLLLLSNIGYMYSMDWMPIKVCERPKHAAYGCLVIVATACIAKKVNNYYVTKTDEMPTSPQDIWAKYENIRKKLHALKEDIHYKNKSVSEFEKERIALLQEIMPDVRLEHKSEREIHHRLMALLCPVHAPLAHAIGDVNQALLDLKRRNNKNQNEQQELEIKGYVL